MKISQKVIADPKMYTVVSPDTKELNKGRKLVIGWGFFHTPTLASAGGVQQKLQPPQKKGTSLRDDATSSASLCTGVLRQKHRTVSSARKGEGNLKARLRKGLVGKVSDPGEPNECLHSDFFKINQQSSKNLQKVNSSARNAWKNTHQPGIKSYVKQLQKLL